MSGEQEEREVCFVIMPFSETHDSRTEEYWTRHFTHFLKPLIEENPKLEARRSHPLRGDLRNEIITAMVSAPIVVADLTDNNPNVLLGVGCAAEFQARHGYYCREGDRATLRHQQ